MSRYIDADAIKDKAWKAESEACFYALDAPEDVVSVTDIDEAPSIDIVFCKECKYYYDGHWCSEWEYLKKSPDDFCSYGVKEGADDE